jgi:hypothetical protein
MTAGDYHLPFATKQKQRNGFARLIYLIGAQDCVKGAV